MCVFFAEFPTNKTELNAVFDIFDQDHNGTLDYKAFVDALKPDVSYELVIFCNF